MQQRRKQVARMATKGHSTKYTTNCMPKKASIGTSEKSLIR